MGKQINPLTTLLGKINFSWNKLSFRIFLIFSDFSISILLSSLEFRFIKSSNVKMDLLIWNRVTALIKFGSNNILFELLFQSFALNYSKFLITHYHSYCQSYSKFNIFELACEKESKFHLLS